jgi:hypothetical protein
VKGTVNNFSVVCEHVKVVDWNVVPEVTSRVVARSLTTGKKEVICLTKGELSCLIDVCCSIRSISLKFLEYQRRIKA